MKLAYAVATPEVGPQVLALSGDLDANLARVASYGYDGVELMPARPAEVDSDGLVSQVRQHGLAVPMVCTGELYGQEGLMFTDPDPNGRRHALDSVKRCCDLAAPFGAAVNLGRVRGRLGEDAQASATLAFEAFSECSEHAAACGVRLLLEPVASGIADFIHTTQDGLAAVEQVGHPSFGIMLDVAHMLAQGEDLNASFRQALGTVHHVHLTDSNRLPPGRGEWDLAAVMEALGESGYDGWISVESRQAPDADTACRTAYNSLRPWQT